MHLTLFGRPQLLDDGAPARYDEGCLLLKPAVWHPTCRRLHDQIDELGIKKAAATGLILIYLVCCLIQLCGELIFPFFLELLGCVSKLMGCPIVCLFFPIMLIAMVTPVSLFFVVLTATFTSVIMMTTMIIHTASICHITNLLVCFTSRYVY